jgi:mono/diheme cytochrome c family protein
MKVIFVFATGLAGLLLAGCSSSGAPGALAIVTASGDSPKGVAGDALLLKVMQGTDELPADATVTWSGAPTVVALDPSSTAASPLPATGAAPTGMFVENPGRPDVASTIADVLYLLDPGTEPDGELKVTATVTGSASGTASIAIPVGAALTGDAGRGATLYGKSGADCAFCHGAAAGGTAAGKGGMYSYDGGEYSFPAPGLDTESGDLGSDPTWNAVLLAMASRADMDNGGLTLRSPMPNWLAEPNPATGSPLTTQDFADIYAFLKTQPSHGGD